MPDTRTDALENSDPQYQSCLLRSWQESGGNDPRVLPLVILSSKSRSFPSLERPFNDLTASRPQPGERKDAGPQNSRPWPFTIQG